VVNTNWDLIRDPARGRYFLRDGQSWLTSSNVLGPWTKTRGLPESFQGLPDGPRWGLVHTAAPLAEPATARAVFVSRPPPH